MNGGANLSRALYAHWAFAPHSLLKRLGVTKFWMANTAITASSMLGLFLCSAADHSIFLKVGCYGFLQHPGIFGWFFIQAFMPLAIYQSLHQTIMSRRAYKGLAKAGEAISFRSRLLEPLARFVALRTERSRALFSVFFTIGLAGFAWNTYNNIFPEDISRKCFWDSISYVYGYFGTRIYKFYVDALLIPAIAHMFAGIVWYSTKYISQLVNEDSLRLLPFSPDGAGGVGFLADLLLSPAITAVLASGLAFLGAVYTHRELDVTVGFGASLEVLTLLFFYIVPTAQVRRTIRKLKGRELDRIDKLQRQWYDQALSAPLPTSDSYELYDTGRYLGDITQRISKIPNWPHLAKVAGVLGLSITPGLVLSIIGTISRWAEPLLAHR